MSRKLLIIIIGIVLVAGGGILFATGVFGGGGTGGAMAEHLSVAEANALPPGQPARVGGDVQPGSVGWNNASGSLVFTLTGDGQDLRVSYPDVAPNDFKPGAKVLVEGTTSGTGFFQATSLQTTTSPLCRACHG